MKLYFAPGACSLADHIALNEAEIPHTRVRVDLKTHQTEDGRDYYEINPKGYVPALELDDGRILTENIAILIHIAEVAGRMLPASGPNAIVPLEMLAFISTELHKGYKPFHNPVASDAEKEEAGANLAKRFAYVGETLSGNRFLLGDLITVADCYLFVMLLWARKFEVELPPSLLSYFDRMRDRPAILQSLKEEGLT